MNKKILLILLGTLFLALCIRTFQRSTGTDFESTYNTAVRIVQHQPIYNMDEGMHGLMWSPFYATFVTPLGVFGPKFASLLFFIFSFAATIFSFIFLLKVFPLETPFLLIAISLSGRFLLDNFMYGQINTFILFFISLFVYLSDKSNSYGIKKKNLFFTISNIFIVFASSIKVFPSIFALTYYPKKIKSTLAGIGIGILTIIIIPAIFFGFTETVSLYYQWYLMLTTSFDRMPLDHYGNQSMTAMLTRFMGYNQDIIRLGVVSSLAVAAVIMLGANKKSLLKKISLITIASIIVSPIVWKHTLTLLVIPNIYIAWRLQKNKFNELKGLKAVFLGIYILFGTFTSTGFIGKTLGLWAMNASLLFFAVVALGVYVYLSNENQYTPTQTNYKRSA